MYMIRNNNCIKVINRSTDMKKVAAPGRKGANKRGSFEGDALVGAINPSEGIFISHFKIWPIYS